MTGSPITKTRFKLSHKLKAHLRDRTSRGQGNRWWGNLGTALPRQGKTISRINRHCPGEGIISPNRRQANFGVDVQQGLGTAAGRPDGLGRVE